MDKRETFLKKIKEFEVKYPDQQKVPRPPHWSGWRILPNEIEFWLNGKNRIHNAFVDPSRSSYDSDEHALEVYRNTVKEISAWIDSLNFVF